MDTHGLAQAVDESYRDAAAMPSRTAQDHKLKEVEMEAAYLMYMLLINLKDWQEQRDGLLPGQVTEVDDLQKETQSVLDANVGAVEIVNALGELERVYFRFPDFCQLLTRRSRDKMLWEVDRETPGKQLSDFVHLFAPEIYREL